MLCVQILKKTFDKVPHKQLFRKLHSYKFNHAVVKWIESFLINRMQSAKVNGIYLRWHKVLSGIPQGSILRPILFIIYINDLIEKICNSEIYLCADDA